MLRSFLSLRRKDLYVFGLFSDRLLRMNQDIVECVRDMSAWEALMTPT